MASELDAYIAAQSQFKETTAQRDKVIQTIGAAAEALRRNPERFSFANAAGGFPPEVAMGRDSVALDAREWPTAQTVQDILVRWHKIKFEFESAWRRLPRDIQDVTNPPAWMKR